MGVVWERCTKVPVPSLEVFKYLAWLPKSTPLKPLKPLMDLFFSNWLDGVLAKLLVFLFCSLFYQRFSRACFEVAGFWKEEHIQKAVLLSGNWGPLGSIWNCQKALC